MPKKRKKRTIKGRMTISESYLHLQGTRNEAMRKGFYIGADSFPMLRKALNISSQLKKEGKGRTRVFELKG